LGSTRCRVERFPVVRDVATLNPPLASATAVVALPRGDTIKIFHPAPEAPSDPDTVVAPAAPAPDEALAPNAVTAKAAAARTSRRRSFMAPSQGLKSFL
jgi:hypothetical protein